ncbi:DNA-binding protein [Achromobacter xylosoxidans]
MIQLRDFDPANYLSDDEAIAHYLADAAGDPDPDVFLQALGDVARAKGVSEPLPRDRFGAHEPLSRARAGSQPKIPDVAPGDGRAGGIVDGHL